MMSTQVARVAVICSEKPPAVNRAASVGCYFARDRKSDSDAARRSVENAEARSLAIKFRVRPGLALFRRRREKQCQSRRSASGLRDKCANTRPPQQRSSKASRDGKTRCSIRQSQCCQWCVRKEMTVPNGYCRCRQNTG